MREVVNTTIYLINKCPSTVLNFKVPDEIWNGVPLDYSHLRVFGCVTCAHMNQEKLELQTKKCMFVGYPSSVKGYKLWCGADGVSKSLISRDVVFKVDLIYMEVNKQVNENSQGDHSVKEQVELKFEKNSSEHEEETKTGDHDQEVSESSGQYDLQGYQLTRD